MKLTILAAVLAAALAGGHAAAVAACPPPVAYPGDDATQQAKARWLAEGAAAVGLPGELPVMGALVASGLANLSGGDADSAGYFAMRVAIWDQGEYAGFRDKPELQLKWFIDHALAIKQSQIAAGDDDFGMDPSTWGEWIADVLRPAAEYRGRYQLRLEQARALIGVLCSEGAPGALPQDAVPSDTPLAPGAAKRVPAVAVAQRDTAAPAVRLKGARTQRVLRRAAILVALSCPAESCTASATATVALSHRRTLRLASTRRHGAAGQTLDLRLRLGHQARASVRRALRSGRSPRALVRVLARDAAGNQTVVRHTIKLTG